MSVVTGRFSSVQQTNRCRSLIVVRDRDPLIYAVIFFVQINIIYVIFKTTFPPTLTAVGVIAHNYTVQAVTNRPPVILIVSPPSPPIAADLGDFTVPLLKFNVVPLRTIIATSVSRTLSLEQNAFAILLFNGHNTACAKNSTA